MEDYEERVKINFSRSIRDLNEQKESSPDKEKTIQKRATTTKNSPVADCAIGIGPQLEARGTGKKQKPVARRGPQSLEARNHATRSAAVGRAKQSSTSSQPCQPA